MDSKRSQIILAKINAERWGDPWHRNRTRTGQEYWDDVIAQATSGRQIEIKKYRGGWYLCFFDSHGIREIPLTKWGKEYVKMKLQENKNMKKRYLFEDEIQYSKEERKAFLESLKTFAQYKEQIYRSKQLKEISQQIGQMIESAEQFTLKETENGWFDNITVNRDLKELKNDYKLFEKTCGEITQLQQRLEGLYENIGTRLGRYYEV